MFIYYAKSTERSKRTMKAKFILKTEDEEKSRKSKNFYSTFPPLLRVLPLKTERLLVVDKTNGGGKFPGPEVRGVEV